MSAAELEKIPQEDKLTKAAKLTNEQKKDLEHNVANRFFVPPAGFMPTGENSLSTEPKYAYTTDAQQQPDSNTKNQPNKSWNDISRFLGQDASNQKSTFDRVVESNQPPQSRIANVYQAYKTGKMSPKDKMEFEQDVTNGLVMLPRGASLSPPSDSENISGMVESVLGKQDNGQSNDAYVNIYNAYKNGKMSPQEKQEFGQDVRDGKIMYPRSMPVGDSTLPKVNVFLDQGIINAYNKGIMTPQERQELEQDLKNKVVTLPPGVTLTAPQPEPSLLDKAKDLFTGDLRKTQESQSLPDYERMPELNNASWASFKTGVGTFISSPQESMQIIKTNYPNVEVKQDSKGNYLVKSSIDGKWYSSKPGLTAAYALRAGTTVSATVAALPAATSLLEVVGLGAATQAGIEGLQSSVGGTFNLGYVIVLSIMSVVLFVLLQADANKIKAFIQDAIFKVRSIRQTMQARKAAALMTSNHTGKISRQKTKASINIRFAFSFDALLSSKLLLTILLCTVIIVILINA